MNYLITGGTGFIGRNFISRLNKELDQVFLLSRQNTITTKNCIHIKSLDEIDSKQKIDWIINLAGSPIDRNWSAKVKTELVNSRLNTTKSLVKLIARLIEKPKAMISASAIGYYGNCHNMSLDEYSSPQPSFTNNLCQMWEAAAKEAEQYNVRVCIMRLGVVLGRSGGFVKKTMIPFCLGLGGKLGSGQQLFSWIHLEDVLNGIEWLINNKTANHIYNFVSPNCCTNEQLTKTIGTYLNRPTILTMPEFLIKLLFGEMGQELLLQGNDIQPKRLITEGFSFKFPELDEAISNIYAK